MPNWYFSKEDLVRTPSRLDGIDYVTEARYRREGTRFIMSCGNKMRLYPFCFIVLFSRWMDREKHIAAIRLNYVIIIRNFIDKTLKLYLEKMFYYIDTSVLLKIYHS